MTQTKTIIGFLFLLICFVFSFVDASRFYFSPSTWEFSYNCPFTVDVMVDMEGNKTTAMDLKIFVDEANYSILDFDGQWWLFATYTKPKYVSIKKWEFAWRNTMYVFLSTLSDSVSVIWWGKVGTLTVYPNKWVWAFPLEFFFIPWSKWEDSNIPVFSGWELIEWLSVVTLFVSLI